MLSDPGVGLPLEVDADVGRISRVAKHGQFQWLRVCNGLEHLSTDLADLSGFDNPGRANAYHLKTDHAILPRLQPDSNA